MPINLTMIYLINILRRSSLYQTPPHRIEQLPVTAILGKVEYAGVV